VEKVNYNAISLFRSLILRCFMPKEILLEADATEVGAGARTVLKRLREAARRNSSIVYREFLTGRYVLASLYKVEKHKVRYSTDVFLNAFCSGLQGCMSVETPISDEVLVATQSEISEKNKDSLLKVFQKSFAEAFESKKKALDDIQEGLNRQGLTVDDFIGSNFFAIYRKSTLEDLDASYMKRVKFYNVFPALLSTGVSALFCSLDYVGRSLGEKVGNGEDVKGS
jgi:hypothetical protein